MDTKGLERSIKTIIRTGQGYGPEFIPTLKQTKLILKRINKGRPTAENYFQLGELCLQLEDSALASEAFQTGYQLNPNHVNCGCYFALLLEQEGKLDQALSVYMALNEIAPENMMLVERMLQIFYDKKDYNQVFKVCQQFLASGASYAVIYEYISKIYFDYGNTEKAIEYLENALELDAGNDAYIQKLIPYYYRNENFENVLQYENYLDAAQDVPIIIPLLFANSLASVGKITEARKYFVKLLARKDDRHSVLTEVALFHQNFEQDIRKGMVINRYVLKREPLNVHALTNLALHSSDQDSLNAYQKVYQQLPNNALVRMNYGHNLIADGQFEQGFDLYESRVDNHMQFLLKRLRYPANIENKNIFVWKEQGLGDEIMWAWFFQFLDESKVNATTQIDERLLSLMERSYPTLTFTSKSHVELLEEDNFSGFDGEVIFASLGKYYGDKITEAQNNFEQEKIKKSFLVADSERVKYWRDRLQQLTSKKTVALCWRSGLLSKFRFIYYMSAEQIVEVFADQDCSVVNVQYDYTEQELETISTALGERFIHFPEIDLKNDQDDLAALLTAVDLVFSAATAVHALAGAVGAKTLCFAYIAENDQTRAFGKPNNIMLPTVEFLGEKNKLLPESINYFRTQLEQTLTAGQ